MIKSGGGLSSSEIAYATYEVWLAGVAFFLIVSPFSLGRKFNIWGPQLLFWMVVTSTFWPVYLFLEFAEFVESLEGGRRGSGVDLDEGLPRDMHEVWLGSDQGPGPFTSGAMPDLPEEREDGAAAASGFPKSGLYPERDDQRAGQGRSSEKVF